MPRAIGRAPALLSSRGHMKGGQMSFLTKRGRRPPFNCWFASTMSPAVGNTLSPCGGSSGVCSSDLIRAISASRTASEKLRIRLQARRWSTRGRVFECPPSGVRNADPADIDQLGTSIDDLILYRYQPSLSQKEKHPICETEVGTMRSRLLIPRSFGTRLCQAAAKRYRWSRPRSAASLKRTGSRSPSLTA
jgi:hypothetical protein